MLYSTMTQDGEGEGKLEQFHTDDVRDEQASDEDAAGIYNRGGREDEGWRKEWGWERKGERDEGMYERILRDERMKRWRKEGWEIYSGIDCINQINKGNCK